MAKAAERSSLDIGEGMVLSPKRLQTSSPDQSFGAVEEALSRLSALEQAVLRARFGLGAQRQHAEQLAALLGLTRLQLCEVEYRALQNLRVLAVRRTPLRGGGRRPNRSLLNAR